MDKRDTFSICSKIGVKSLQFVPGRDVLLYFGKEIPAGNYLYAWTMATAGFDYSKF